MWNSQNAQVSYIHILSKGLWRCGKTMKICQQERSWWRHQMETFSALLALCAGNSPAPVNSPHKGQWRGALMFSLICTWINGWVNNREAGDLRRYRNHYDVILMLPEALDIDQPVTRSQVAHLSCPFPLWRTRKMDHLPQSCKYNDVN